MTSIGFVNFVVFTVREQPWKSIPSSDGTFWGSFSVWRGDERAGGGGARANSWASSSGCGRPSVSRTTSEATAGRTGRAGARTSASMSARVRTDAGLARVRLDLEREDRLEACMRRAHARHAEAEESSDSDDFPAEMARRQASGNGKGKMRAEDV